MPTRLRAGGGWRWWIQGARGFGLADYYVRGGGFVTGAGPVPRGGTGAPADFKTIRWQHSRRMKINIGE